jgi:hypothetical protein
LRIKRHHLSGRIRAFGLLVLQLVIVAAAPVADARLEAEDARPVSPAEVGIVSPHEHGHDHAQCQLCKALQIASDLPGPAVLPGFAAPAVKLTRPALSASQPALLPGSSRPRAPPAV